MNSSQDHLGEDAVTELPEYWGITMDILPTLNLVRKKYMLALKGKVIPEYKSKVHTHACTALVIFPHRSQGDMVLPRVKQEIQLSENWLVHEVPNVLGRDVFTLLWSAFCTLWGALMQGKLKVPSFIELCYTVS